MQAEAPEARTSLYADALSEAEQAAYFAALDVPGLDQEIAVLRAKLRTQLKENNLRGVLRLVDGLAKALVARLKLAPGSEEQLLRAVRALLAETAALEEQRGDGS
ncbi:MAG TPA: hypothetical protein VNN10_13760 [Dehalococcoidia bacterium]|nr:hypothetical protein [Dehalococcoidia bacterium]